MIKRTKISCPTIRRHPNDAQIIQLKNLFAIKIYVFANLMGKILLLCVFLIQLQREIK